MAVSTWTEKDTATAKQIWAKCQKTHDLSFHAGQMVGIDPKTSRIWFGESIRNVVAQRDTDGLESPLRFERVGSDTYYRKGGHRCSSEMFPKTMFLRLQCH